MVRLDVIEGIYFEGMENFKNAINDNQKEIEENEENFEKIKVVLLQVIKDNVRLIYEI